MFKGFSIDNGRVRVLSVILIQLPRIAALLLGQMVFHISLLQQTVARILLVGQYFNHMIGRPFSAKAPWHLCFPKSCRDPHAAFTVQIRLEYVPHHSGLCFMDHDLSMFASVPVQQHQIDRLSFGEILAYPALAVVRHALALLLRKRSEDGEHQLAIPAHGVNVLFLKVNVNAQRFQLTYRFEHGHGIARKPADGLGQNQIDFSRTAVQEHLTKPGPFPFGAGVCLIRIHTRVFPVRMALDTGTVVADLR